MTLIDVDTIVRHRAFVGLGGTVKVNVSYNEDRNWYDCSVKVSFAHIDEHVGISRSWKLTDPSTWEFTYMIKQLVTLLDNLANHYLP